MKINEHQAKASEKKTAKVGGTEITFQEIHNYFRQASEYQAVAFWMTIGFVKAIVFCVATVWIVVSLLSLVGIKI